VDCKILAQIRAVTIFATFGKVYEHCISECEYRASPMFALNSSKPTAEAVGYLPLGEGSRAKRGRMRGLE